MMKRMGSAALVAAVMCSAAWANEVEPATPIPFRAMAKVWIDETGQPSQVQATSGLPAAVRESIEQQVATWRFQSPVVDGVARGGITYVALGACAVPEPDGSLRLALAFIGNGPGYANDAVRLEPPRYPRDLASRGQSGEWTIDYIVETDGSTTFSGLRETRPKQPFIKLVEPALRDWVASLRYVPEEIAGVPVRTRVSTPVRFLIDRSPAEEKHETESSRACSAVMKQDAGVRPVAVDSPFRLLDAG